MNFPMEYPIYQFFYWLVNTPTVGSLILMLLVGGTVAAAFLTLRWIRAARDADGESSAVPYHE